MIHYLEWEGKGKQNSQITKENRNKKNIYGSYSIAQETTYQHRISCYQYLKHVQHNFPLKKKKKKKQSSKISNHGFDHGTGEMKLFMAGKIE